jgi:dTMP kinase
MRGRFITFEGGEGTGKSTHSILLSDRLEALGIDVVLTREPGGSPGAEVIRHVLLSGVAKPLGVKAEALLFAAARDDHVRTTIEPALVRGAWVICDRFIDSTRVYQGTLGNLDPNLIRALERVTVGELKRRGEGTADRFEAESRAFHEALRDAYQALATDEPGRCLLIDATEPKLAVAERIWKSVSERLDPVSAPVRRAGAAS